MNGVSGVSGSSYMSQLASGTRIQSAADGASELSIIEKMKAQTNGTDQGTENTEDAQSLLKTADGAYNEITSNLHRMRELAVQAGNTAVLSEDDISSIQDEIEKLKEQITEAADSTQFNGKKLLDGTNKELNIQIGANSGDAKKVGTGEATLTALGLEDFDVTKNFDIQKIDDAIAKVSSSRSQIGAQSNMLSYVIDSNKQYSFDLTSSISRMSDTDYAKTVPEQKKEELLQSIRFIMQKRQAEQKQQSMNIFI